MEEEMGFEPMSHRWLPVFKTGALNHALPLFRKGATYYRSTHGEVA
jgi:hypothetical protein